VKGDGVGSDGVDRDERERVGGRFERGLLLEFAEHGLARPLVVVGLPAGEAQDALLSWNRFVEQEDVVAVADDDVDCRDGLRENRISQVPHQSFGPASNSREPTSLPHSGQYSGATTTE
jgi:hypothetical protein